MLGTLTSTRPHATVGKKAGRWPSFQASWAGWLDGSTKKHGVDLSPGQSKDEAQEQAVSAWRKDGAVPCATK